jgi:hypothetical protein
MSEQGTDTVKDRPFDRLWIVYMTTLLSSIFLSQKMFDKAFPDESQYVYIIIAWLVTLLVVYLIGRKISVKIIQIILVVCAALASIVWLNYTAALPALDLQTSQCQTWDCHLLQELAAGTMSDTWAIGSIGLTILILTQFTIMPPLLMVFYRSQHQAEKYTFDAGSLFWMAGLLIVTGVLEIYLPSYIAMLFVTGIQIFSFLLCIFHPSIRKSDSPTNEKSRFVPFNFWVFLQNLLALAAVTVFVFMFTETRYYIFERTWQMGIGVLLFYLWMRLITSHFAKSIPEQIWWLDVFFFTALVMGTAMGWNYYFSESSLRTDSGISPIISGILYAYFSVRLNLYLRHPNPVPSRSIPVFFLKRPLGDWFILNLMLLIVYIGAMVEIRPQDNEAFITFIPGLIIAILGWILVLLRKSK